MRGIGPNKDYYINALGGKRWGYQTVAYYYVSWKLYNPEMHKTLQLPFDSAWEIAMQLYNTRKIPNNKL